MTHPCRSRWRLVTRPCSRVATSLRHGLGHLGWQEDRAAAAPPPQSRQGSYQPDLAEKFTLADALHAMAGHVIARARLDGTYEIR
jgi:hypothetical protein